MSTNNPTPERVTLTADQKRVLHTCPGCGHLLDSHDGSGCSAYDDESLRCTCDADSRTMETTYESVAALLAAREQALTEAYETWRDEGRRLHTALLTIWRMLGEDRKHMTYGDDPERVVAEVLSREQALREEYEGPVLLTRGSVIEAVVGEDTANRVITATLRVVGWAATPDQLVVTFEDVR